MRFILNPRSIPLPSVLPRAAVMLSPAQRPTSTPSSPRCHSALPRSPQSAIATSPYYGPSLLRARMRALRASIRLTCVLRRPLAAGAAPCRICRRVGGGGGGDGRRPCGKCVVEAGAGFTQRGDFIMRGGAGRLAAPLHAAAAAP